MPDDCKHEHKFDDKHSLSSSSCYSLSSDDRDDASEEKEEKFMALGESFFYMIRKGDIPQRFDSADWALAQEKEKEKHTGRALLMEGLDDLVDFDEEPPQRCSKVSSEGPRMGAKVTAQRLLSKHSTGSSSGDGSVISACSSW